MLTFFTGTDTAKKREHIEKKMLESMNVGKKVFLIVPEQSAFNRDRDFLFRYGEHDSDVLSVTGLERFICETLEENGLAVKPSAESAARTAVMSLAVEAVKESLEVFSMHGSRPSTVNELLSTYNEIKQAGASPAMLGRIGGSAARKARELSLIFSAYDSLINERFSDPTDNISRFCELLNEKHGLFTNCVFFFDDFRGYTGEQIRLIALLCAEADDAYVSVTSPDFNENDGSEAFGHARRNARAVKREADKKAIKNRVICTDGEKSGDDAISFLRDTLFTAETVRYENDAPEICVYEAKSVADECSFVAMSIKKLIESGACRCRDIGIYQRSDSYMYPLTAELKRCGIPVCEDARKQLGEYPLVRMLLAGAECAVRGLSSQRVFTYLKTGVAGISEDECDLLENYVTRWGIDGKAWEFDFKGNPDGYGVDFNEERKRTLDTINGIRKRAVELLTELRKSLGACDAQKSCAAIYGLIEKTGAKGEFLRLAEGLSESGYEKEAIACARVWDETAEALDALYNALGDAPVSPVRFFELLTLILCVDSIGEIPAGVDKIVIGSADRTRFLAPKAVFVVGLNDGEFPLRSVRGGVFTSTEKRELIEHGIVLESIPEKIYGEERLIAYTAVTVSSDKLFLSYSMQNARGEDAQPSEVITEIKTRVPNCTGIKSTDIGIEERVYSPSAALDIYASRVGERDTLTASLKDALCSFAGYAEKAKAVEYAYKGIPASFSDKTLSRELFGTQLYVSPSRLEAYAKCPFMYFCRYGVKAKPVEPIVLDARINGLLVHRVFEVLLGRYSKKELSRLSYEARKQAVDETTDEYIRENMGGVEALSSAVRRQTERQKKIIFDILNRLISEFDTSSFEVSDVELEIKSGSTVEPISVRDGDIEVTLHGTVDRVDTFRDGDILYFRVIDYKTGGKDFVLSDVFEGLNMQMLVYLTAIWLNGKGKYENGIPAGVLYVPARTGGKTVGRNASQSEIEAQKLKNGQMNGIILENETVLRGMEQDAGGVFVKQYIKDGKMYGELYSLDDMERIKNKLERVILSELHEMLDGVVPARPVLDGDYSHTCEYCQYSAVCRRENDGDRKEYRKYKFDDAIKLLREEAKEE